MLRRKDRAITDIRQINEVLQAAKIVHLGMIDHNRPYVVPLNYGYEWQEEQLILYIHGAMSGRKIEVLKQNPHVFVEIDHYLGAIDGKEIPCKYSSAYASIMADGVAKLLTEPTEKIHGLNVLMRTQTNRDFAMTEKMVKMVQVIQINLFNLSAKQRLMPESN